MALMALIAELGRREQGLGPHGGHESRKSGALDARLRR